ncbi:MAG: hypothetical protein HON65_10750 [Rhodospirillales bacterium]|jgi:hypothetical protein|nr:hypothetical protein [Rhodospirillales bacterium]
MNRSIVLKSRPTGEMSTEHFEVREVQSPDPGDGDIMIQLQYLSIDPYLRGKMNDGKSYTEPFAIGGVIENSAIGQVIASRNTAPIMCELELLQINPLGKQPVHPICHLRFRGVGDSIHSIII